MMNEGSNDSNRVKIKKIFESLVERKGQRDKGGESDNRESGSREKERMEESKKIYVILHRGKRRTRRGRRERRMGC